MPIDELVYAAASAQWQSYASSVTPIPVPPADDYVSTVTIPDAHYAGAGLTAIGNSAITTTVNGSVVLTSPNEVIENTAFLGTVKVHAAGVRMKNCPIVGPANATQELWLLDTSDSRCVDFQGEFLSLIPRAPNSYINGIGPRNFTIRRSRIQGTTDLVSIFATASGGSVNAYVYDNFLEWMTYSHPDVAAPSHTDGTHNDAIQFQGGDGGVVRGNFIGGYLGRLISDNPSLYPASGRTTQATSAIMLNNNNLGSGIVPLTNFQIEDNWVGGGFWAINGGGLNGATASGTIRRNKFYTDQFSPGNYINLDGAGGSGAVPADSNTNGSRNILTSGNTLIDGTPFVTGTSTVVKRNQ
jgi:hypothetical protein